MYSVWYLPVWDKTSVPPALQITAYNLKNFFYPIPLGLNLLPLIYNPGHSQLIHLEQNHAKAVGRPF